MTRVRESWKYLTAFQILKCPVRNASEKRFCVAPSGAFGLVFSVCFNYGNWKNIR
jgi:hypothetical protein